MEEINLDDIYKMIESWDKEKIREATKLLKGREELLDAVDNRYWGLYSMALKGATLLSLANLPAKWEKLNTTKRAKLIEHWPEGARFFTTVVDLSATERVDAWRDSHYTHRLEEIPETLGNLKGVKELRLSNQKLKRFPMAICRLKSLEILDLENNDLETIPEEVTELKKLRVIILKRNYGLESIPDLGRCPLLEKLDLNYTRINSLGEEFFKLNYLKSLTIINSEIDKNIALVERLVNIFPSITLHTGARGSLKLAKADESRFKGKKSIVIDDWNIERLPDSLFRADAVIKLELDCHNLKELQDSFAGLNRLQELIINVGGELTVLPESIGRLTALKSLTIDANGLENLPESLGELLNLESLCINSFKLKALPKSIGGLKSLKRLQIESNSFTQLSAELAKVESLEELTLVRVGGVKNALAIDSRFLNHKGLKSVKIEQVYKLSPDLYNLPRSLECLELSLAYQAGPGTGYPQLRFGRLLNHFCRLNRVMLEHVGLIDDGVKLEEGNSLKELYINGAYFPAIPESISSLKALETLKVRDCELKEVTTALYDCPLLRYIESYKNDLLTLPEGIERLTNLSYLAFKRTPIRELPQGIFELENLKYLDIPGTPLGRNDSFKRKIKRKIEGIKVSAGS